MLSLAAVDEGVDAHLPNAGETVIVSHVRAGALAGGSLWLVASGAGARHAVAVAVLWLVAGIGRVARMTEAAERGVVMG